MSRVLCSSIPEHLGKKIQIKGWLCGLRQLGQVSFLIIQDRSGLVQAVFEGEHQAPALQSVVCVEGEVRRDERAVGGHEIVGSGLTVLAHAASPLPLHLKNGPERMPIDTLLEHRVLALRNERIAAPLRLKAAFVDCFRRYFSQRGFLEIFTPKIVGVGTEGGAELFTVEYFERKAYLSQSPQLYKQMMVGAGFERVFEIGPVFRAEEHNTSRHLNQFLSLDIEMGFIDDVEDLMRLEEEFLRCAFSEMAVSCRHTLEMYGVEMPEVAPIPRIDLGEAIQMVEDRLQKKMPPGNLDPSGERALSKAILETTDSEFVFVTGYPKSVRPFYVMPDDSKPDKTKSFDLLFKGLEVTTGGQRINNHDMMVSNMLLNGLVPEQFSGYLQAFKYGMPPHGGFAIGAERVIARLLNLPNVRSATAFVRDRTRLSP